MIKVEILIKASLLNVWTSLVEETNEWWGPAHYTSPYTKKMELQDYIGGKLMEDFGNREGIVWAEVIGVKAPQFIMLHGYLAPEYGGPNTSFSKIFLKEQEDCTLIQYEESWMLESSDPAFDKNLEKGWEAIFMDLKKYVEHIYPST